MTLKPQQKCIWWEDYWKFSPDPQETSSVCPLTPRNRSVARPAAASHRFRWLMTQRAKLFLAISSYFIQPPPRQANKVFRRPRHATFAPTNFPEWTVWKWTGKSQCSFWETVGDGRCSLWVISENTATTPNVNLGDTAIIEFVQSRAEPH